MRPFRHRRLTAVVALATVLVTAAPPTAASAGDNHQRRTGYHRVGYFTQWGIYGRAFPVKKLETSGAASRLTHLNYAFGNVSEDGRCYVDGGPGEGDAWADYQRPVPAEESVDGVADAPGQALNGNFGQLAKLKAKHPELKVLISLGGWSWSTYFSNAARTDASRKAFVTSCIDLYLKETCPVVTAPLAARAPGPASSTASTSTGSGPTGRVSPATSSARRTGRTSPSCSPSSAGSSTRTGARPARTTR